MSCIYKLNDKLVCGGEPTDGVHFPCAYCRNEEDGPSECEAEAALGVRCHLFLDETNRHMFPAYASAGTRAMDEIKDLLFAPITSTTDTSEWDMDKLRAAVRLARFSPTAPITDADIQNAEALQDEMYYTELHDTCDAHEYALDDTAILRAAAHVLRMAKETGPTKMTAVLYLDQWAEEAEKAEEEAQQ